jgi:hypothetical protein
VDGRTFDVKTALRAFCAAMTLFQFVTTGLDPVVHAESPDIRARPKNRLSISMDCRIKSGHDVWRMRIIGVRRSCRKTSRVKCADSSAKIQAPLTSPPR